MQDNPILRSFRNLTILILYTLSYALISFFVLYFGLGLEFSSAIIESLVSAVILCGLTIVWHYPAKYISIEQNSFFKILFSHIITAIISSGLWILFIYVIMVPFLGFNDRRLSPSAKPG